MLIVGVHLDASLPAWSGLERDGLSFSTSFPLIIPPCLSPSLSSPIPMLSASHPSPCPSLTPPPPIPHSISLLVLLSKHPPTPQTPLSQNMRYICFPLPGCESGTRGVQSADVLVSG